MRKPLPLLGLLAAAGCLNQVAPLTGLADGGDAGSICDWRSVGDAGLCTNDSQCPDNYYCDFTVTACPNDGLSTVNAGSCLPACPVTSDPPDRYGVACQVGEDCAPEETCYCEAGGGGTIQQPCDAGHCALLLGGPPCSPGANNAGCMQIRTPHTPWGACVCPGNTCSVPNPCEIDGTPCDGGFCVDGGCGYGCWINGAFVPSDDPLDGGNCYGCYPWISTMQRTYLPEGSVCLDTPDQSAKCYYGNLGPIEDPCTCTTPASFDCPYIPYDGDAGWVLPCCGRGKCNPATGTCCEWMSGSRCESDDWCCDNGRCLPGPDGFNHCYWDAGT